MLYEQRSNSARQLTPENFRVGGARVVAHGWDASAACLAETGEMGRFMRDNEEG